ncbi:MAG: hypothetical protein M5U34_25635 [Chloroflexi bacterium]|nr:hypothetical protein [Chloroflexota bacterium]
MKSSVYIAIPLFLGLAVLQTAVLPYFPLIWGCGTTAAAGGG